MLTAISPKLTAFSDYQELNLPFSIGLKGFSPKDVNRSVPNHPHFAINSSKAIPC